jgi:hypothetical protein
MDSAATAIAIFMVPSCLIDPGVLDAVENLNLGQRQAHAQRMAHGSQTGRESPAQTWPEVLNPEKKGMSSQAGSLRWMVTARN